ncbi:helix-turn-helix transcriptional regulator [Streptomyces sp. NPDC046197]|uniref:helix-turn-helix domain-containing protein n=1 Tax=Streptomyces sp. NPDC046197 TaxID=3154337 RepID=UPI0033EE4A72
MSEQAPNDARVIPLRPPSRRLQASPAQETSPPRPWTARPASARPAAPPARTGHVTPRPVAAPGRSPVTAKEPLWRDLVGDVLRRERLAQERTLKEVAEAARISMPYLSEIERGRKEASSEVLAAAAHALGLGLGDLLSLAQSELLRSAGRTTNRGRRPAGSPYDGLCLAA